MFLICLIFLSTYIRTGQASLNQAELEEAFLSEVVNVGAADSKTLRRLSHEQLAFLCKQIFQNDSYKYEWKIHLNELAHYEIKWNLYRYKKVTFIDSNTKSTGDVNANQISLIMSPCFGHHRPIRTHWNVDDYYEKFFVSPAMNWDIIYIFRVERERNGKVITVVHDRIQFSGDVENIPKLVIKSDRLLWDTYLNEVVTINYDSKLVEEIYVHEMIPNHDSFEDPLFKLDIGSLVTICWSIFSEKLVINDEFLFKPSEMFSNGKQFLLTSITFPYMNKFDGMIQKMTPCRGPPATGKNRNFHIYKISGGRRKNSVFVFKKYKNRRGVQPMYFIENFDFTNLTPSDKDETEIYDYSNTNIDDPLNLRL